MVEQQVSKTWASSSLQDMRWEDAWMAFLLVAAAVVFAFLVVVLASTKRVDGYYLSHGAGATGVAVCAYAHWTWHPDERAFCTNDIQQAVSLVGQLNEDLRKK